MYKTNRYRNKRLILSYSSTRRLYYLVKILTFFLILFTIIVLFVGIKMNTDQQRIKENLFGKWNVVIFDINQEDIQYFEQHAFIKRFSIQSIYENFLINKEHIVVGSSDNEFIELGNIHLISGRMPNKNQEVAIEKHCLEALQVSKVGDIVPSDSLAYSLRGYRVCGIIDNYSQRWEMINRDMRYINCFISSQQKGESLIFIESDNYINKDLNINFVNCVNNIDFSNNKTLIIDIVILWILAIIFNIMISFLIKIKVSQYKSLFMEGNKKMHRKQYTRFLCGLSTLFLLLISIWLTNTFIDKIFSIKNYSEKLLMTSSFNESNKDIIVNSFRNIYYFFETSYNGIFFKRVYFILDNSICNMIEMIILFIWIVLINIIIVIFTQNEISFISQKVENYWNLQYYYYGRHFRKIRFKFYLILNILIVFLYLSIFHLRHFQMRNDITKMYIIFMGITMLELIFNSFNVFLKYYIDNK